MNYLVYSEPSLPLYLLMWFHLNILDVVFREFMVQIVLFILIIGIIVKESHQYTL